MSKSCPSVLVRTVERSLTHPTSPVRFRGRFFKESKMIPDHFRRVRSAIETGYHAENVRAEALESLDEIRMRWQPGECCWRLADRQGGYFQPGCNSSAMVLKVFGSRFCSLCGSPLTVSEDY